MKISLINPPSPFLENDAAYPPMGLMYVAAALENSGNIVEIIDLSGHKSWVDYFNSWNFETTDLFGITCVTPNLSMVTNIIQKLPKGIPVMVGGAHPTFLPDDTLENTNCTTVIVGESEEILSNVIQDLRHGSLKKIYYGNNVSIDHIPKPARHLVNLKLYTPGGDQATPIYSSRGCPFNCNFCSKITGTTYRELPINRVIEELEDVISLGFKKIVFGDDNIAINRLRLQQLLLKIKPYGIKFRLNQDARHMDEKTLNLSYEAGCTDISFGIESGSQKILDAMNKQTTVEKNADAIKLTKKCGIDVKAYFMVNFPGETEETVQETLKFAENTNPDKWLLSSFAPLPGSDVYRNPNKYGITSMSRDWSDYYLVGKGGKFKPCFTTNFLTHKKQIELHSMAYNGLKEILG
jgi:radical SAM superfamily enzyme YgiQ (UPF0313 family)